MANLIEDLATPPQKIRLDTSAMGRWLATKGEAEQAAIMAAALNPDWGHVALLEKLVQYGAPEISDKTFGSWRKAKGLQK